MKLRILIVEDQFIQATHLGDILTKEGHQVIGFAQSVDEALLLVSKESPDMVFVDIFLADALTGIDLAKVLNHKDIPFLFVSANSNESTLALARETQPFGFLVKPYREKDILVAMDIAIYRHRQNMDLKTKQTLWLNRELKPFIENASGTGVKISEFLKAFHSFIPFDGVLLDLNTADTDISSIFQLKRTSYNDYIEVNSWDFFETENLPLKSLNVLRQGFDEFDDLFFLSGSQVKSLCLKNKILALFVEHNEIGSIIGLPASYGKGLRANLLFFSKDCDAYHPTQAAVLRASRSLIVSILNNIHTTKQKKNGTSLVTNSTTQHRNVKEKLKHIIGNSSKLLFVLDQVNQVASFDTTVIIEGETGVGKEGIALAIHELSSRKALPMIKINCAAIPRNLIEAELFGYEKGSFTDATQRRLGKFEQANGSTIFLDEIGEIPLDIQGKLLRIIQEKELERLGSANTVKLDVRIIAATNRNLYNEVTTGNFRLDLYYRLHVFPISVPSLRERKEDIPLLTKHFLNYFASKDKLEEKSITDEAMQKLMDYPWPGNIRELQHVIERHVLTAGSNQISSIELPEIESPSDSDAKAASFLTMDEYDRKHIMEALKICNGKISGKGGAAELLQMPANTLTAKMKKLGISWKFIYD
ncbi:sigma 54-interacting response regulator [Pedobacter aquatilis]|uniref:sigma 54-interacting response regulator n=1 Tax=Pedobacter aquatilis TaxID=351343 RepID=UPI002930A0AA|nr:sigma 54-interacting response regulator [Pedobacter aquatilis]